LLHEVDADKNLINDLKNEYKVNLDVFEFNDPIDIKAFISNSYILIGSRYHSLVNSLSQGIPTLGTSWAHKYHELFKDYNCDDNIIDISDNYEKKLNDKFNMFTNISMRGEFLDDLNKYVVRNKAKTNEMWALVDSFIGI